MIVDRRFRDAHNPLQRLTDFSKRVETGIWVVDGRLALERLLEEAVAALDAVGGAAYWQADGTERRIATHGRWDEEPCLDLPLAVGDRPVGRIALGPRRNDSAYTPEGLHALSAAANAIAQALPAASQLPLARVH